MTLATLLTLLFAAAPAQASAAAPAAREPAAAPPPAAVTPAPAESIAGDAAPAARADPCDGVASLPEDDGCAGAPLCSPRQRAKLACDLRDAMEKRYVFFPVKGRLLAHGGTPSFDSRAHLDACVAEERAIAREDDPLRFYDRMRRCTAAFEDGHLLFGAPVRLPQVALGFGLRLADGGKIVIANREKKLVSYLAKVSGLRGVDQVLAVGNEVLEIDGRPAAEVVEELARFVPASSRGARLERAVDAVTRRDFAYPQRRTATLAVSVKGVRRVVELPWWISPDAAGHVMASRYVRRTGIVTSDLLAWRYDQGKDTWDRDPNAAQGYLRTDPILAPRDARGLTEELDEGDRVAVRVGEVVRRRDRAFCYVQILSFLSETLHAAGDEPRPFGAVLEGFVGECKDKGLDLVVDLRQNTGGYIAHSSTVAAMLSEPGEAYPGGALVLRATTQNQLVYQQRMPPPSAAPARAADDAFEPRKIVEAIGLAQRERRDYTPAFLEGPVRASDAVGGYEGRVVVLTSPSCMSACDRLAGMLRASRRAVLLGGPTEGAGGSQQEAKNLGARWTDPDGLLSLSIPNAAMGVQPLEPGAPLAAHAERSAEEFFAALAFENRPVQPDVPYATSVEDITGHNRGWLEQVEAVLFEGRAVHEGIAGF
ncbi:S41 family peptidase [Anaeromyxobacter soli]|uniref:S41 family peptidase n=1 Tax=Anaeromyxobacter soli TaxID=2922725 RepID=UPI001FAEF152|nr:S41 family peptidase [Anaeromyxobacter sp. SG29]